MLLIFQHRPSLAPRLPQVCPGTRSTGTRATPESSIEKNASQRRLDASLDGQMAYADRSLSSIPLAPCPRGIGAACDVDIPLVVCCAFLIRYKVGADAMPLSPTAWCDTTHGLTSRVR